MREIGMPLWALVSNHGAWQDHLQADGQPNTGTGRHPARMTGPVHA
jgi:hypothetical protein